MENYMEFVYRKKKTKYRYHIKTPIGTVCKMENGMDFKKLDTVSEVPPEGRKLCQMCDAILNKNQLLMDKIINRSPWEREATWE